MDHSEVLIQACHLWGVELVFIGYFPLTENDNPLTRNNLINEKSVWIPVNSNSSWFPVNSNSSWLPVNGNSFLFTVNGNLIFR